MVGMTPEYNKQVLPSLNGRTCVHCIDCAVLIMLSTAYFIGSGAIVQSAP